MSMRSLEWITAILLSVVVAVLLMVRAQHAGALWRDECASVQLAEMPRTADVLNNFQRESFPAPFPFKLRAYAALFGTSDAALRAFGFLVGLTFVLVVWINSFLLTKAPPLLVTALLGLNTSFLIWGTSVRAYGIGSVLILLAFGLVAKMLVEPSRLRIAAAFFACLASVQFLLYNSVLLLAIGLAGFIVCFARRKLRAGIALAVICVLCAVAVLPYVGPFRYESQSTVVFQSPVDFAWLGQQLTLAFGHPTPVTALLWGALYFAAVIGALLLLYVRRSKMTTPARDYLLYGVLVALVAPLLYLVFLAIVSYRTREWYYLALLAVVAGAIDLLVANLIHIRWIRIGRLAVVGCALAFMPWVAWPKISERQSNMDIVARRLAETAQPNDLIVVNPWFLGVGFNWYYRGTTPWTTCPSFDDHRIHRFDLLKEKMAATGPIDDVLEKISHTMRSGNRVWFVGELTILPPDRMAVTLPPAPASEYGWSGDAYAQTWSQQMGDLVRAHAGNAQLMHVPVSQTVNEFEDVPVLVASGWRE